MITYDGNEIFYKYYEKWIEIYKEGAIRNSTMQKCNSNHIDCKRLWNVCTENE